MSTESSSSTESTSQEFAEIVVRISKVEFVHEDGTPILRGVEARVRGGDVVVLVGPPESGKSTLLRLVGGDEEPTKGKVRVAGSIADDLEEDAEIYLFDEPTRSLDPEARAAFWHRLAERAAAGAAAMVADDDFQAMEACAGEVWLVDEGQVRDLGSPSKAVEKHGRPLITGRAATPAIAARLRLAAVDLGLEPLGGHRGEWVFDVKTPAYEDLVPQLARACPDAEVGYVAEGLEAVARRAAARSHGRKSRSTGR